MKSGSVLLLTLATACLVLLLQSRGTHARAFDMNMLDERETAEGAFQKRDAALRNTLKSLIMRKNTDDRQKRGGSKSIDYAEDMVKFALWCRQMNIEC